MDDFDDLRNLNDDDRSSGRMAFDDLSADDEFEGMAIEDESDFASTASSGPFLGMSARERMVLSIMLFGNVVVLGIGLLMATGRMG
jgi:hypothetical protein